MPHDTPAPGPRKRRPPLRPVWDLLSETYKEWRKDNAQTLGAALAFYTTFSMAPLLIIVIAIFGVILGKETVQVEILKRAQELIGAQGAAAVKMMIGAAYRPGTGLAATIIGILVILVGSTSALVMLTHSPNNIWGANLNAKAPIWNLIKERLLSFAMILVIGLLLVLSLLLSIVLSFLTGFFQNLLPVPPFFIEVCDFVLSFILITLLFAVVYKVLPNVKIAWGRCLGWLSHHRPPLHPGQLPVRHVPGPEQHQVGLRSRQLPGHHSHVGLLFRPGLSHGRGIDPGLRQPLRLPGKTPALTPG